MYEHSEAEIWNQIKIEAAMHGIDVEKTIKEDGGGRQVKKEEKGFFRDPEEYKDLSDEEKEALTQEMMKKLKGWAASPANPLVRAGVKGS